MISDNNTEELPLPLIVAQRWRFSLRHFQTENGLLYNLSEWVRTILSVSTEELISELEASYPEIAEKIKCYSIKNDTRPLSRYYASEETLMAVLFVITPKQYSCYRAIQIRNDIARIAPQYKYLAIHKKEERPKTNEAKFQARLVEAFKSAIPSCTIAEFYKTTSGHKADILLMNETRDFYLLIECKGDGGYSRFYQAVGQIMSYYTELAEESPEANWILAIALPQNMIDNYMLTIISKIPFPIHLITVLNGKVIDFTLSEATNPPRPKHGGFGGHLRHYRAKAPAQSPALSLFCRQFLCQSHPIENALTNFEYVD
jgi:hypothetical protein